MDDDNPMTVEPKRIADSTALILISRFSMAACIPLFTVIAYLFWGYIDLRFDKMSDHVAVIERTADDASTLAGKANDRLTAVETRQSSDATSSDKFQRETLKRLDDVQTSISTLASAVAGLTATINAMEKQSHSGG